MVWSEIYPIQRILDMFMCSYTKRLIYALIIQVVSFAKVLVGFEYVNSGDNNLKKCIKSDVKAKIFALN